MITVKEIRVNNGIVRGYKDSNEPMYAYDGNIVQMEYLRNGISIGIWNSAFIILCWNVLMQVKKR